MFELKKKHLGLDEKADLKIDLHLNFKLSLGMGLCFEFEECADLAKEIEK